MPSNAASWKLQREAPLGRGPHGGHAAGLDLRHRRVGLDIALMCRVDRHMALDDNLGLGEAARDIAPRMHGSPADIGRLGRLGFDTFGVAVLVQHWCVGPHGLLDGHHRR